MRSPFVLLPSLMLLGVVLALQSAATPSASVHNEAGAVASQNESELRQEQQAISERLDKLKTERRRLVVRGGI